MRRRRLIGLLVVRWGFAAMVAVTITAGVVAGATVAIPADVPSVALSAVPVYRIEVGAAVFLGLYLATMAFVLAMHDRGFAEIGTGGVKAQGMAAEVNADFEELILDLMVEVRDLQDWAKENGYAG